MAKTWIIAVVLALMAPVAQGGENSALKALVTGSDNKGWEAVGRLNFAGRSFCTGAMIAPDLVLTAAHCLFDRDSGRRFAAADIEFLAGWRNGSANAKATIGRAIVHPQFEFQGSEQSVRVAYDLALLQLSQPIRKSSVVPFETQARPRKGARVGVVSYGRGRAQNPSLQEFCNVLARRSGTLVLSCEVDFGSSGAPVFVIGDDGVARIVSVISSMAKISGRDVSLGTNLEKPLADLMALMANAEALPAKTDGGVRVIRLSNSGDGTGAKFVRP